MKKTRPFPPQALIEQAEEEEAIRLASAPELKEWVVENWLTLGGAFIIVKFSLHQWVTDIWGMIALGGFFFICGLPGWAVVRWVFNLIEQREGRTILDIVREFKEEWKK